LCNRPLSCSVSVCTASIRNISARSEETEFITAAMFKTFLDSHNKQMDTIQHSLDSLNSVDVPHRTNYRPKWQYFSPALAHQLAYEFPTCAINQTQPAYRHWSVLIVRLWTNSQNATVWHFPRMLLKQIFILLFKLWIYTFCVDIYVIRLSYIINI
jgi:hypothetical protein